MNRYIKFIIGITILSLMVFFYWRETVRINNALHQTNRWNPPTSFRETYKEICTIAKNCAIKYDELTWYISSEKTLPSGLCGDDKVGCFLMDSRTIILTDTTDATVIRHEMMHAAWADNAYYMNHHCKFFNTKYNTWWYEAC